MAKTLEERAIELMNTLPVDEPKGLVYEAYKKGASDQRKRDIEKACYFIKRNTTLDRWVNVDAIAEQLRKTMENEQ